MVQKNAFLFNFWYVFIFYQCPIYIKSNHNRIMHCSFYSKPFVVSPGGTCTITTACCHQKQRLVKLIIHILLSYQRAADKQGGK